MFDQNSPQTAQKILKRPANLLALYGGKELALRGDSYRAVAPMRVDVSQAAATLTVVLRLRQK